MSRITTTRPFAVIGAGIAGLACAAALAAAGREVTVFDKGRRPGGRVATRRGGPSGADPAAFDHGAQFATAHHPDFAAIIAELAAEGHLAPWHDAAREGHAAPWVGVPGMSALPRALADRLAASGVRFELERHVAWLHGHGALRHLPASEARPGSTHAEGGALAEGFAAILLAIPAPQAIPLLRTLDHPGTADFAARLEPVTLAPCWTLMVSLPAPIDGPGVIRPTEGPLSWIARTRPASSSSTPSCSWVLQASPAWSRAHLEAAPEQVTASLLAAFQQAVGQALAPIFLKPVFTAAHRWRHALVETPLGVPCLWNADANIGLCGDWCLGARIEAAYDSGTALARAALAQGSP